MALKGQTFLDSKYRGSSAIVAIIVGFSLSSTVFAQSSMPAESLENSKTTVQPSEGLSFNLPASPDFTSQTGPLLELPPSAVGSTLFKLDLTDPGCANGSGACLRRSDQMDLGLTDTFRRRSEKGLDLSLTPRASLRFDDEISSTAVGAVIEIGEDLRTGSEFKSNTWYFFAGADAEALTYSPSSVGRITSGEFHLQDRIIVGDAQAGLGYRIGDADVSLSYMRREASTEEFTYKEDAAALSFTWKR
ncbi:hypothetical protein GCM10011309_17850 [Litorimonas cladophorae]|uniref:Uncharacterized protein n=1 Tax=Litorimonas cladophorae TaxID=1220491 RepID=A0A918KM12_9PROT|nr:lipid A-modifier LpxR family protein [Litorimonas cladophorae]GGX68499.1 hypothetical protein GCM10011309_17850 [Litorimonas cladophorae]